MSEIATDTRGAVRWLTIDREARRNAFTTPMLEALIAALDEADRDDAIRAIKLIAGKGKIDVQALSDAMNLLAQLDVKVESATGRLILTAKQEVWMGAGGSYISIKAEGIENVTTGHILERCVSWDKPGGASATNLDPLQATPVATKGGRGLRFSG